MKRLLLGGILLVALSVAPVQNAEAKAPYCDTALMNCLSDCRSVSSSLPWPVSTLFQIGCNRGCVIGYVNC